MHKFSGSTYLYGRTNPQRGYLGTPGTVSSPGTRMVPILGGDAIGPNCVDGCGPRARIHRPTGASSHPPMTGCRPRQCDPAPLHVLENARTFPYNQFHFEYDEDLESPNMVCARTAFTCVARTKVGTDGVSDRVFDECWRLTRQVCDMHSFHNQNVVTRRGEYGAEPRFP